MKPEPEMSEADGTCEKIKCDGQKCRAMAVAGSQYCFFHDPATAKVRKAAQRQGGEANGPTVLPADAADVPLRSGRDVSAFLAETINQVRKGQVSPKIATTVGYLSSLLMKALETTDIEERLARIEQVLKMRGAEETFFNPDEDEGGPMGTDQRRLDKAESSLTPREVVALWVQELARFDSLEDYVFWMNDDSSRPPLGRMLQQIRKGIPRRSGVRGQDQYRELLFRERSSEVVFLYHLLLGVNQHVCGFLGRERSRIAAITAGLQAVNERICSAMAMFESWKGLADMPYPLEPNIAAAVSSALRSDVTSFDDLVLEIVDQESNRTADQVVNEESENACEQLKRAIDDLCRGGLVKRGWRLTLEPTPIELLSEPPLVDGVWIDRMAVELAESAATLCERGIKLEVPADCHPLAPLRLRRTREIPGEPEPEAPSEGEMANARADAAARLLTFTGRTKEIDARPYIHLDDYRAWSERKAGDDLGVTEGVVNASWNAWVEARGDKPELAGIRVGKLDSYLKEDDFFSCNNPERRRRRAERASAIRLLMINSDEVSKLEGLLRLIGSAYAAP